MPNIVDFILIILDSLHTGSFMKSLTLKRDQNQDLLYGKITKNMRFSLPPLPIFQDFEIFLIFFAFAP